MGLILTNLSQKTGDKVEAKKGPREDQGETKERFWLYVIRIDKYDTNRKF